MEMRLYEIASTLWATAMPDGRALTRQLLDAIVSNSDLVQYPVPLLSARPDQADVVGWVRQLKTADPGGGGWSLLAEIECFDPDSWPEGLEPTATILVNERRLIDCTLGRSFRDDADRGPMPPDLKLKNNEIDPADDGGVVDQEQLDRAREALGWVSDEEG